jgi:hypothetical protein
MIYILALDDYMENTLEGYATNENEIIKIAENYVRMYSYFEDGPLCIVIENDKVLITERDGWRYDYTIHTVERVK